MLKNYPMDYQAPQWTGHDIQALKDAGDLEIQLAAS